MVATVYKDISKIGDDSHTAKFGWQFLINQTTYNFGYINSFKEAGDILVKNLDKEAVPDLFMFPIMFCYRHYLELVLKNICYSNLSKEDAQTFINKASHDLKKIWETAQPFIMTTRDKKQIDFIEKVVSDFYNLDPNSFNFRYPQDKKLNYTLRESCNFIKKENSESIIVEQLTINLKNVQKNIDKVDDILYDTYGV